MNTATSVDAPIWVVARYVARAITRAMVSRRRSTVNGFQRTGTRGTSKKPSGGRGCLAPCWRPAGGAPNLRDREHAPAADARRQRLTDHASCGLQGGPISWSAPQSGKTTGARGVPSIRRKKRAT